VLEGVVEGLRGAAGVAGPAGPVGLLSAVGPSGWRRGQPPVQPDYDYRPVVPQPGKDGRTNAVMTILGVFVALGMVMVFISAFLPWVTSAGTSLSGVNLMTMQGEGFFMIRWGWGGILFTGFFSLVIGSLMIVPAILLFLNRGGGPAWSIVTGVFGFFMALVNVILIYATYNNGEAGAGLWLMLAFSVVVLACGIVGLRYSG
jgi:hypothetical protein